MGVHVTRWLQGMQLCTTLAACTIHRGVSWPSTPSCPNVATASTCPAITCHSTAIPCCLCTTKCTASRSVQPFTVSKLPRRQSSGTGSGVCCWLAEVIFYHGTYERFSNWVRYHHYFVLSATRDSQISVLGLINMVVYMDWVVVSHSQPFLAQLGLNPSDAPDPAADLKAFESAFHLLDQSMDDSERVLANSLLTGLSSYIHCGTCPQLARSWNLELSAELRARSSHQDYVCTEVRGAGNWFRYCIGMLMLAVYHMCVPIHLSFLGLAKLRQGQRERVVRTNHAISHVLSRRSWWHCIYVLLYFSVGLTPWCVLYIVMTGWSNDKVMGEGEL